ncbi:MAG: hypothetical protein WC136_09690 [Sphaerochaeta sp.]|nr:hypothetical protein [Sphaerochaeta sp.]
MSKAHRGSGIRTEVNHGRGLCPVCKRTEVKVLFEATVEGEKVKICKACNAHLKATAAK